MEGLGPLFFEVHSDLPREGPGSPASTRRALELARPWLPARPSVVDAGCGPGAQTAVLAAELPGAKITALDLHEPFLDQVRARGLDGVEPVRADMGSWSPPAPVDLVWCEGAAYFIGVERAVAVWRDWLVPGGCLALSDAVWLTDAPHPEAAAMWEEYPAMGDRAACLAKLTTGGYRVLGDFVLPREDWLEEYYAPLQRRLDRLREQHAGDPDALAELAEHQREIDVCRAHGEDYSYLFVVARRED